MSKFHEGREKADVTQQACRIIDYIESIPHTDFVVYYAIQVANDKDWHRVIFESDSNTLVDCISSPTRGRSKFHALVSLIKSILVLHPDFEVKFVRRQANMAAHTLVGAACSWASHRVFEICPPCIDTILSNDMN